MNDQQKSKHARRQGGVLLMAMLVMLAITILAVGLYKMHQTAGVEGVYLEHNRQAFWVAESGLADGEFIVQYSKAFRDNPASFTIPQGVTNESVQGYYDLNINRTTIDAVAGIYDFEITSTGHVKGFNRRLRKTVRALPGGKYAIIGISGHTDLSANVEVNGPVAQIEGTVNIHDSRDLNGYLIMGDGEGSLTDKKGEAVVANVPPPPSPSIDATEYIDLLTAASSSLPVHTNDVTVTDAALSGTNIYNFAASTSTVYTVVFDSKLKVADDSVIIVRNGNIRFNKSGVNIGERARIVAGNDIRFRVQATVEAGAEIFAVNDIIFESGSGLLSTDPVLLMALNGDIIMNSNFDFLGIMIAEKGEVALNANGDISGSIIGGVGVDANANITINYDERVFTEGTPVIPKSFGDVILTDRNWEELQPL